MKQNNEFDSINDLFLKIVKKEEKKGNDSLTLEERVVLAIWHASGIIGNGGFQYFFEQNLDAAWLAEAYERIGCKKCATVLRQTIAVFPRKILKSDLETRVVFVERNSAKYEKPDLPDQNLRK